MRNTLCDCIGRGIFIPGQVSELVPEHLHVLGPPICYFCGGLGRIPKESRKAACKNFKAITGRLMFGMARLHPASDPQRPKFMLGATPVGLSYKLLRGIEQDVISLVKQYGAEPGSLALKIKNGLLKEPLAHLRTWRRKAVQDAWAGRVTTTMGIVPALVYMHYNQPAKVVSTLEQLRKTYVDLPNRVALEIAFGDFYYFYERDYPQALQYYEQALQLDHSSENYYNLGLCYIAMKCYADDIDYQSLERRAIFHLEQAAAYNHPRAVETLKALEQAIEIDTEGSSEEPSTAFSAAQYTAYMRELVRETARDKKTLKN